MYKLTVAPTIKKTWVLYFTDKKSAKVVARFYDREVAEAVLNQLNDSL
ncbi:hypothetical protein vBAspATola_40 [Aeromonas phage vB_AspA_Tola]|nr:hypothetical protein vBAspATola_40 [Aeromonas phage vB_AspA_Tola]